MEFEKNIEGLIRAKTFGELTDGERETVLSRISEKEYGQFRLVLCGTKNRLNTRTTVPSPRVKANLMAAMREQRKERRPVATFLTKVGNFQVPMWQAAAAFVGLLFMAVWGKNQVVIAPSADNFNSGQVVLVDTVFETKYDTVYREMPAARLAGKKVNVSPQKVFIKKEKATPSRNHLVKNIAKTNENKAKYSDFNGMLTDIPLLADTTLPRRLREVNTHKNSLWNEKSIGRSVKQEEELMQFFSEIN
ncbi:MAG: hypothetical protein ACI9XO_001120 [Paraglaciecola sp.]|jgi:hypothetical protein